jgi:Phytanoyl-CoA dioxygenase (PhyH)
MRLRLRKSELDEIDELVASIRDGRDPVVETQIRDLRHRAGVRLAKREAKRPAQPEPDFDALPNGSGVPEIGPAELTAPLLRAAILSRGCVLVRGLVARDLALEMAADVDRAYEAREARWADEGRTAGGGLAGYYEELVAQPPFDLAPDRFFVSGPGGLWLADSPAVLHEVLQAFDSSGLKRVITEYLGERAVLSVDKCVLRRIEPDIFKNSDQSPWHQDGAFLGDVRALNVWLALSHCGDIAPGMDIIPRRMEEIVATGTEGATFDWSVSRALAERAAGDAGIVRPIFEPGDVLLFDEMLLHATAADDSMTERRYASESWFFGPSGFPGEYVPLAF